MTCFLAKLHGFDSECEPPIDRAHIGFRKQTLKRAGLTPEEVWDRRVWRYSCRKHHEMSHWASTPSLTRQQLPESVEQYADEKGLTYRLDADFGPREAAVE